MSTEYIKEVKTSVAGCTMGEERNGRPIRQLFLEELAKMKPRDIKVRIVPEDDNKFDADALRVMATTRYGDIHIGYVQNRDRFCYKCNQEYAVNSKDKNKPAFCSTCGSELRRKGLASEIREAIRNNISYKVECLQITGGGLNLKGQPKNYGCNIRIYTTDQ
jgi:hypothetical protein